MGPNAVRQVGLERVTKKPSVVLFKNAGRRLAITRQPTPCPISEWVRGSTTKALVLQTSLCRRVTCRIHQFKAGVAQSIERGGSNAEDMGENPIACAIWFYCVH